LASLLASLLVSRLELAVVFDGPCLVPVFVAAWAFLIEGVVLWLKRTFNLHVCALENKKTATLQLINAYVCVWY
jgi:hypothetical protein